MSELDEFASWAVRSGHYTVAPLVENFRKYQAQAKEQERDVINEKAQRDHD